MASGANVSFVHQDWSAAGSKETRHDPGDALASGRCFLASRDRGMPLSFDESFGFRAAYEAGSLSVSFDDGATWRACGAALDPQRTTGEAAVVPWKSWLRPGDGVLVVRADRT